ncbi:hypothetical protein ACFLTM_05435, partial [Candidatus Bipolaricaulota bacterium]
LGVTAVSALLGARVSFLDAGLRLAAEGGFGYYYVLLDSSTIFEIPVEYPDAISGVPPDEEERFTGSSLGFEVGLNLSYPIAQWLSIGSTVTYRSATVNSVANSAGDELDLDGDGTREPIDLDGITVRLVLSLNIDLSLNGEKE